MNDESTWVEEDLTVPEEHRSDKLTTKQRIEICKSCEHLKESETFKLNLCGVCGCVMRFKVVMKSLRCPEGKW